MSRPYQDPPRIYVSTRSAGSRQQPVGDDSGSTRGTQRESRHQTPTNIVHPYSDIDSHQMRSTENGQQPVGDNSAPTRGPYRDQRESHHQPNIHHSYYDAYRYDNRSPANGPAQQNAPNSMGTHRVEDQSRNPTHYQSGGDNWAQGRGSYGDQRESHHQPNIQHSYYDAYRYGPAQENVSNPMGNHHVEDQSRNPTHNQSGGDIWAQGRGSYGFQQESHHQPNIHHSYYNIYRYDNRSQANGPAQQDVSNPMGNYREEDQGRNPTHNQSGGDIWAQGIGPYGYQHENHHQTSANIVQSSDDFRNENRLPANGPPQGVQHDAQHLPGNGSLNRGSNQNFHNNSDSQVNEVSQEQHYYNQPIHNQNNNDEADDEDEDEPDYRRNLCSDRPQEDWHTHTSRWLAETAPPKSQLGNPNRYCPHYNTPDGRFHASSNNATSMPQSVPNHDSRNAANQKDHQPHEEAPRQPLGDELAPATPRSENSVEAFPPGPQILGSVNPEKLQKYTRRAKRGKGKLIYQEYSTTEKQAYRRHMLHLIKQNDRFHDQNRVHMEDYLGQWPALLDILKDEEALKRCLARYDSPEEDTSDDSREYNAANQESHEPAGGGSRQHLGDELTRPRPRHGSSHSNLRPPARQILGSVDPEILAKYTSMAKRGEGKHIYEECSKTEKQAYRRDPMLQIKENDRFHHQRRVDVEDHLGQWPALLGILKDEDAVLRNDNMGVRVEEHLRQHPMGLAKMLCEAEDNEKHHLAMIKQLRSELNNAKLEAKKDKATITSLKSATDVLENMAYETANKASYYEDMANKRLDRSRHMEKMAVKNYNKADRYEKMANENAIRADRYEKMANENAIRADRYEKMYNDLASKSVSIEHSYLLQNGQKILVGSGKPPSPTVHSHNDV